MYLGLDYSLETATRMTARSIAFPGTSEHQTGLALDVTINGQLNQKFAETEAGRWIDAYCYKYGFIIRYPKDKTDITNILYEPWHLRYVGMPHSAFMKENNFCLEEYMDYLYENRMYLFWINEKEYYKVTYSRNPDYDINKPQNLVDISIDRPGPGAWYIITTRDCLPELWPEEVNEVTSAAPQ